MSKSEGLSCRSNDGNESFRNTRINTQISKSVATIRKKKKQDKPIFTYIDLFAGIGGFHSAADALGGECLFASEIDGDAKTAYEANYGIKPFGDITQIDAKEIPDHDILLAGFPCQPFSIIGNRLGFDDIRGTLFFEIARILKKKKPPIFVLENVKQLSTHNKGHTLATIISKLEQLGYKTSWKVLNALDYGVPQKRERTIIVGFKDHSINFEFPQKIKRKTLEQILEDEDDIDAKHFASETIVSKRIATHKSKHEVAIWHENKSGNISSYPYSCALRAGASYNYLLVNGRRRLTPRELLRLQGFPDSFKIVCNDSQTRKQAGNAVPVSMVKEVLKQVLYAASKTER
ncbi:MAG: DNA (cytosine-5-)-methyltransferase [Gallionellales bacterium CG_4_8_14_3_um_filter_54_18]|nr:MAG: DNA (cytosine-5-)-methyltransferase [Gallionellales bacterium CG_4_8_14_3_um_filter_54_18]